MRNDAPSLHHGISQFLYREARLLDEGRFDEWLALFADDVDYWMPTRETTSRREDGIRKKDELALIRDDKTFLAARVQRLHTGLAHAESPPSRTRHFCSNIEIMSATDKELVVQCNILVFQSRLEKSEAWFVGTRTDALRVAGESWLIARRTIVLDQTLLPRAITTFF